MRKSFTIIEILVVTFIISLFSSLSIVYYRNVERQFALQRSAYKLAQDIKRAQQMAMSAKECPSATICEGTVPPGYGIYINRDYSNYYILYADTNWSPGGNNRERYDDNDLIIETIPLEKGVKFFEGGTPPWVSINFSPPDPKITISRPAVTTTAVTTTLSLISNPSIRKTIHINIMGLVEIK